MVDAGDQRPVERDVRNERLERIAQRIDRAVVVHVLRVDIGDDRDGRGQLHEGAVGLVRLDHHPAALALAGIRAVGLDDAAIDHGRVLAAGIEQRRDQRGRGGLAMGAADGDVRAQPHQFGQHLGPAHHRQGAGAGRIEFRVAALDRRRDHHHPRLAQVLGRLADMDRSAEAAQARDDRALLQVRALHRVAQVQHHLGDPRHADAADADKVDRTDVEGQCGRRVHVCFSR